MVDGGVLGCVECKWATEANLPQVLRGVLSRVQVHILELASPNQSGLPIISWKLHILFAPRCSVLAPSISSSKG